MAADDHAIVVGINRYPSLSDLGGPENDATDFANWLKKPDGGGVPGNRIALILSSHYAEAGNPLDAEPTTARVERAFDDLYEEGTGNAGRAGRRLYIYLAGHGFAPDIEEAALLMANAARGRTGHHIPGRPYANWFRKAAYFDEVVLFMDCCRDNLPRAPLRAPPYEVINSGTAARRYYGFATKWSRTSREKKLADGRVSGVFTKALLAGLSGGAADASGTITGTSLQDHVFNTVPSLLPANEIQEPEFDFDKKQDIVFGTTTALFDVKVTVPAALKGQPITLQDGKFATVAPKKTHAGGASYRLNFGLYRVSAGGRPWQTIELVGQPREVTVELA